MAVVASDLCEPGQYWNGGACAGTLACQLGNFWNGTSCWADASECATYDSRAAVFTNELRGIRGEMARACMQDPNDQQCRDLTRQHDMGLSGYRGLLNESPARCRLAMPDPLSL
jgi:hypothetical protein